jgi:hypothetical protein
MGARHLVWSLATLTLVSGAYGINLCASDAGAMRLSRYHTFFILQGNSSGSPTEDQRIRADLETALDARGWVDVPRDEAQAVVVAHTATAEDHSYRTFYKGWGGWPWMESPGAASGVAKDYKVGTVVVDIFDAQSKQALWSGVAPNAASMNPGKSGRGTEAALDRMFRDFPATEPTGDEALPVSDRVSSDVADVPRIIFEQAPALLVVIDGEPEYRAIDGTGLDRVANARPFIIRDGDGIHYMKVADGWMQSYTLTGMWSVAGTVPHGAEAALAQALEARDARPLDLLQAGLPPALDRSALSSTPAIHVSMTPAALIVTEGQPVFAPVEGSSLLYIKNATGRVLKEPTDQELYVLVSGEWYRAWTLSGPWQHVPAEDLPADIHL